MNNIIQSFMEKGINSLQEKTLSLVRSRSGLSEIVTEIKKETDELGRRIYIEITEALDSSILKDRGRKKEWYVQRRHDEKTIITKLGV